MVASATVEQVHAHFLSKIYNCRCNEYLKSIQKEFLTHQNKSVDVHVGLRDQLKTYAYKNNYNCCHHYQGRNYHRGRGGTCLLDFRQVQSKQILSQFPYDV